jgi:hypothetical protein
VAEEDRTLQAEMMAVTAGDRAAAEETTGVVEAREEMITATVAGKEDKEDKAAVVEEIAGAVAARTATLKNDSKAYKRQ